MKNIYEKEIILDTNDVDFELKMDISSIMKFFVACASAHAHDLEIDYFVLKENFNATWVITKLKFKIYQYPLWNQKIILKTWPHHPRIIKAFRDFEIWSEQQLLIEGSSEWCIIDIDSRRPKKLESTGYPKKLVVYDKKTKVDDFESIPNIQEEEHFSFERTIRSSDLDINMHTNNIIYGKMIMDAFSSEELKNPISEFELHFMNESKEFERIDIYRAQEKDKYIVQGLNKDKGTTVFKAMIRKLEGKFFP